MLQTIRKCIQNQEDLQSELVTLKKKFQYNEASTAPGGRDNSALTSSEFRHSPSREHSKFQKASIEDLSKSEYIQRSNTSASKANHQLYDHTNDERSKTDFLNRNDREREFRKNLDYRQSTELAMSREWPRTESATEQTDRSRSVTPSQGFARPSTGNRATERYEPGHNEGTKDPIQKYLPNSTEQIRKTQGYDSPSKQEMRSTSHQNRSPNQSRSQVNNQPHMYLQDNGSSYLNKSENTPFGIREPNAQKSKDKIQEDIDKYTVNIY